MLLTSVLFGVGSAILALALTVMSPNQKNPLAAAVMSCSITFLVCWAATAIFMPEFTYFLSGGYFWGTVTAIATAVVSSIVFSEGDPTVPGIGGGVLAAVILVIKFIAMPIMVSPGVCNDGGNQNVIQYLHMKDSKDAHPDLDINSAIKVSKAHAYQKASNNIPREGNITSYLELGEPYLQNVQGHPYYVVALQVKDWRAYSNAGGAVPGYMLVDATDTEAPAKWHQLAPDHMIRYVQGAQMFTGLDVDRKAYFDYAVTHGVRLDELDGMEVDDELNPWYTAAILKPAVGYKLYYPVGMILLNPNTGEIKEFNLADIPAWVDRRLSYDTATSLVNWWAEYSNHKVVCGWDTTQGKKKIDDQAFVWGPDGLLFQYVMTSVGSDNVAQDLIYVNPRTLEATRYDMQGVNQTVVKETMQSRAKSRLFQDLAAVNCQIEWIAGKQAWYCILEKNGTYWAVGLVQPSFTQASNSTGYIVDQSLQAAVEQLRIQIATGAAPQGDQQIPNSAQYKQIEGTVERVGQLTFNQENNQWSGNFVVKTTIDGVEAHVFCRYAASNLAGSFLHEGDQVIVSLLTVNTDKVNDVVSITNKTYPLTVQFITPQ